MARPAIARRVAFDILLRVRAGAYASELLMAQTVSLESRDAGLAAEIVLGVLRRQGQLDETIEMYSGRGMDRLDPEVAIAIRMAIYQIRHLDRVPAYAAVNDSLNLLREARKTSSVGFANAVLRKASAGTEMADGRAIPVWLMEKWTRDMGASLAMRAAEASLHVPELYQHVPEGCSPPAGGTATDVPGCWKVTEPDPRYRVQDIGSQALVARMRIEPSHRMLDVCSAPGNKTSQALERTPQTFASDLSFQRLKQLKILGCPLVVLDATKPLPFGSVFDRILVDAPCSGTGTFAHNPEIKWRLSPADLGRFAERQANILDNALAALRPGGLLLYSTCSLEPEENEAVARRVAGDRIECEVRRIPGRDPGDGFYAAVIR